MRIRDDIRRDGLSMNFLLDEDMMSLLAQSFPNSLMNIGYPGICSKEKEICKRIVTRLSSEPIETAVVGHALKSHLDLMAEVTRDTNNSSAVFWIPFSDYFISQTLKQEPDKILKDSANLIRYWRRISELPLDIALADTTAKQQGLDTRLFRFYDVLKEAGARRLTVCDTRGIATPSSLKKLMRNIPPGTEKYWEFHPHNDSGRALDNIALMDSLGVSTIGTAVFGHGERGTMIDPRVLVKAYNLPFNATAFSDFYNSYCKLISGLEEPDQLFSEGTIVTGSQHRLYQRKAKKLLFGVTSDRHILSQLSGIPQDQIPEGLLEAVKNRLYAEKERTYNSEKLIAKIREIQDGK